jgi:lipid II:glycine glycyltransferase (peptidoglycan interpeptide bridge formation enzyme)
MIRYATQEEIADWNTYIAKNPDGGRILQTAEYGSFKRIGSWHAHYIFVDKIAVMVIEKQVPFLGKVWYVPKGPGVTSAKDIVSLVSQLSTLAKSHHAFVIKVDPEIEYSKKGEDTLIANGFLRVNLVQPNQSTVILDISPSEDDIIARFNQKTRNAIRRAEREGIVIKPVKATTKNCQIFYKQYCETAVGQWRTRDFDYYRTFWQSFEASGKGQMFFAYNGKTMVASAYVLLFEGVGTYKDGASSRARPVYGTSHFLQWEIIKWLKQHKATSYDLCGTPPSDRIDDLTHSYYGFGKFKISFSKDVTDFIGTYDMPLRPLRYRIWTKIARNIVMRLNFLLGKSYWF